VGNPNNDALRVPLLFYNPRIKNPQKETVKGNFYLLSLPTTILDLMVHTKSLVQQLQQDLANRFAANYEQAQSLLRPVFETIRYFGVNPGGGSWVVDNGRNLRARSLRSALISV
jgi:arylsulfatase A-like enzyme